MFRAFRTAAALAVPVVAFGTACGTEAEVEHVSAPITAEQCSFFNINAKIQICHKTASIKKPYTILRVDYAGCINGHAGHIGDYIAYNDPTCAGLGCFPLGAPNDPNHPVPCCDGMDYDATGHCAIIDPCANVNCTPSDACHVAGECDPATGDCSNPAKTCADNNACTHDSCDPATGCVFANNTASCDDHNACTANDACSGGSCQGGAPVVVCNDDNACTTDSCDPITGACVFADNTAACDDGNPCTLDDTCSAGACVGMNKDCDDGNPCTDSYCHTYYGTCFHNPNLAPCDDGNPCTVDDVCNDNSVCQSGAVKSCDDHNACTADTETCDPSLANGCAHEPTNEFGTCATGSACIPDGYCSDGACTSDNGCDGGFIDGSTDGYNAGTTDAGAGCQFNADVRICDGDGCIDTPNCAELCTVCDPSQGPCDERTPYETAYADGYRAGYNFGFQEALPDGSVCCRPNFTGEHCDIDVDECANYPCTYNDICENTYGGFECIAQCPCWKAAVAKDLLANILSGGPATCYAKTIFEVLGEGTAVGSLAASTNTLSGSLQQYVTYNQESAGCDFKARFPDGHRERRGARISQAQADACLADLEDEQLMIQFGGPVACLDDASGGEFALTIEGQTYSVSFTPNTFVYDDGNPAPAGDCEVRMGVRPNGFDGSWETTDGAEFQAMVLANFVFRDENGTPLHVAPGKQVTIRLPLPAGCAGEFALPGEPIDLYSYDEGLGLWQFETTGGVEVGVDNALYAVASVSHFTWYGAAPTTASAKACVKVTLVTDLGQPVQGAILQSHFLPLPATATAYFQPASGTNTSGQICLQTKVGVDNEVQVMSLPIGFTVLPAPVVLNAAGNTTGVCLLNTCRSITITVQDTRQEVFSLSPNIGPPSGGTLITVTGRNFGPWTRNSNFSSYRCDNITVLDSTHFTCVTEPAAVPNCTEFNLPTDFSVQDMRASNYFNRLNAAFTYHRDALIIGGNGTAADPFLVNTRAEFDAIRYCPRMDFRQTADIDLSGCDTFVPLPGFDGNYDGNGFELQNYCATAGSGNDSRSLFSFAYGTIRNVDAVNFNVAENAAPRDSRLGGLVGTLGGTLSGCTITGTVVGGGASNYTNHRGGLVGFAARGSHIINCAADVDVSGPSFVGGLVGASAGEISASSATGNVSAGYCVGGLAGEARNAVYDSEAHGVVTGSIDVGGFVGCAWELTVARCHATGDVSGSASVGGFAGAVENETTPGARVTPTGIGSISDSYATGDVHSNGWSYFYGGLVGGGNFWGYDGCATGSITRSYATGDVLSYGYYYHGGLVGSSCMSITDSYALGDVYGGTPAGGLVGAQLSPAINIGWGFWGVTQSTGTISGSFAAGRVRGWSGLSPYAGFPGGIGGLVGASWGPISDSYALGPVEGTGGGAHVGGLVGVNGGAITSSFVASPFVGGIDGTTYAPLAGEAGHGLVGLQGIAGVFVDGVGWHLAGPGETPNTAAVASVATSYYRSDLLADPTGTAVASGAMGSTGSFVGFDFVGKWIVPSTHPLSLVPAPALRWECGKNGVLCP